MQLILAYQSGGNKYTKLLAQQYFNTKSKLMSYFLNRSFLILCFILISANLFATLRPVNLTCEYRKEPLGIEAIQPRFGWWIDASQPGTHQSVYQIQIASSEQKLVQGLANIWNTGKVRSDCNFSVSYTGVSLQSGQKYYWRVRIWDQLGKVSQWSEVSEFGTGILNQREWDNSHWIAFEVLPDSLKLIPGYHGKGDVLGRAVNPYFRKSFSIRKKIENASIFVSGLGQYELYLNGNKVSRDFLTPGWTKYDKRCLYNTYDVTKQLRQGENIVSSLVGTGFFYINHERYRKFVGAYGFPMFRLILRIRFTDGTTREVVTDETWKTAASPLCYSSIYGGEDYDARQEQSGWNKKGFNDVNWKQAILTSGPGGTMASQVEYPLRVMDTIGVKKISSPVVGKYIYDFGQNASGIIALKVQGKSGDTIRIIPSELLDHHGLISQKSSGSPYYFEYILKGNGIEEWIPRFTYYGFRYAMIEGAIPHRAGKISGARIVSLKFLHTRNSTPATGSFDCSNKLFNQIYHLIDWSLRSNIASVSTDCPHREKMGWLEQSHLMGESLKNNYDVSLLYNKIVDDIIEAQQPDGMVPSTAPEYVEFTGAFRDDPGYGSAAIILPWYLYKWYGDKQALIKSYDMMKRYVSYLGAKAESNIILYGLGDWLDLGPNNPGEAQLTPIALTATCFYYQDIVLLGKMAQILDKDSDALKYEALAKEIKNAFNNKFFNPVTKVYGTGSQTSYSMPLYMGLVENETDRKRVFENLTDSILIHNKRITAGDIGHRFLVQTLEQNGASELLYQMNNRTDIPGYGYQIKNGATALAEHWSGPTIDWLSQNHMIFGHLMEWFYSGLTGIRQQEGDSGFKRIIIDPQTVGDITWVKSSYKSINGKIKVEWTKTGNQFSLNVDIPANAESDIVLPGSDINLIVLNGNKLMKYKGIKNIKKENGRVIVTVPSGQYKFVCKTIQLQINIIEN